MPRKPKSPDELKKRKKLRRSQVEVDLENELDANEVENEELGEENNEVVMPNSGSSSDDSPPNRDEQIDLDGEESERRPDDSNNDDNTVDSLLPEEPLADLDENDTGKRPSKKSKRKRSPKPVDALTARRLFRHVLINR